VPYSDVQVSAQRGEGLQTLVGRWEWPREEGEGLKREGIYSESR